MFHLHGAPHKLHNAFKVHYFILCPFKGSSRFHRRDSCFSSSLPCFETAYFSGKFLGTLLFGMGAAKPTALSDAGPTT